MKIQLSTLTILTVALAAVLVTPASLVFAAQPGFGHLFYNGTVVRTVVPPSATTVALDNFYAVTNGASGQLGIAAVAPGSPNYHGGHWIKNIVTFNQGITPYLLTSEAAVLAAQAAGDVSIQRNTGSFLCPIQP